MVFDMSKNCCRILSNIFLKIKSVLSTPICRKETGLKFLKLSKYYSIYWQFDIIYLCLCFEFWPLIYYDFIWNILFIYLYLVSFNEFVKNYPFQISFSKNRIERLMPPHFPDRPTLSWPVTFRSLWFKANADSITLIIILLLKIVLSIVIK